MRHRWTYSHECEEHLFIISVCHERQSTTSLLLGSGRASRPRRKGVASALMAEAEDRARGMGVEELYLGVRSGNELALQMYSRMGYEMIVPSGDMLAFLEVQKEVRMLRGSLAR